MSWCIPIFAAWFGDPGGVVPSAYQRWQLEARQFVQTSCLHIDLRFRCNCSRLYRGLTILGRQKCLPKTVSETVYQSHNSIGSNDGYLQTSLQSRHRATWHTIPLQAMVFWLACELLCVLSDDLWKHPVGVVLQKGVIALLSWLRGTITGSFLYGPVFLCIGITSNLN